MDIQRFWRREKHVALNAQPRNFRIAKWIVIAIVFALVSWWKGISAAIVFFLACALLGTCAHFFLRYKTGGWTRSWGPYKRIPLEEDIKN